MNIINFQSGAVRSWAEFSGDFNPIHFDLDRANQAGSDKIIVHGMLPLMYAKQEVTQAHLLAGDDGAALSIKALLKRPVKLADDYAIHVKASSNGGRFSISECASSSTAVQGTYASEINPAEVRSDASRRLLVGSVSDRLSRFAVDFPSISCLWIAFDGIAFSEFLRSEIPFQLAKSMGMTGLAEDQSALMAQALTVQTSHRCRVAPSWVRKKFGDDSSDLSLDIHVQDPVALNTSDSELLASIDLDVYVDQELAISSEIGLMMKTTQQ